MILKEYNLAKLFLEYLSAKNDNTVKTYKIDWVNPVEHRISFMFDGYRFSFSKFIFDNTKEIYFHNHPWYKEMKILHGNVIHNISYLEHTLKDTDIHNPDENKFLSENILSSQILTKNSILSINSPNCYHQLIANTDVYTVMVNKEPWFKGPKSPNEKIVELTKAEIVDIISKIQYEM
jgi:hypothetical protein